MPIFFPDLELSGLLPENGATGSAGFVISGVDEKDQSGRSVSGGGDINGDGFDDIIVGAGYAAAEGRAYAGQSYVVFGTDAGFSAAIEPAALDGTNGFTLNGGNARDFSGRAVSIGGDINGDGVDDLIIGARFASPDGRAYAGQAYVVFGTATGFDAAVNLAGLDGTNGFTLGGLDAGDNLGSVGFAGDINGDGVDDLIIGASGADPDGRENAGETYVVFGSTTAFDAAIDLAELDGTNGFIVNGIGAGDIFGRSAAAAGDVNGDGVDDLIIGAPYASPNDQNRAGAGYVVFGSDAGFGPTLDLAGLDGTSGFTLNTMQAGNRIGVAVGTAGDINGDGIADLHIGAQGARQSYIVFGSATGFDAAIDLAGLDGTKGFIVNEAGFFNAAGFSASQAGDVNGDGLDDIIIGAYRADPGDRDDAGQSYVVFGSAAGFGATLDLADLDGANGFALNGIDAADLSGFSVSGAGDVDGDGLDDLIIGAWRASPEGRVEAGESYVVFGSDLPLVRITGPAILNEGETVALMVDAAGPVDGDQTVTLTLIGNAAGRVILSETTLTIPDGQTQAMVDLSAVDDTVLTGAETLAVAIQATSDGIHAVGPGQMLQLVDDEATFPSAFDLAGLGGTNGFVIEGIGDGDRLGRSVDAAGDINGDGIDDLIIGAYFAGANGQEDTGESYVVFGSRDGFDPVIDPADLDGTNGFVLRGLVAYDFFGDSVSGAGDINGDGIDDVIISASRADPDGRDGAGQSYVVFGSAAGFGAAVDLSGLDGSNGFTLNGANAYELSGVSVSGAGDIDGDGVDDLIIGTQGASPGDRNAAGQSYIVFGSAAGFDASLDLASLDGSNGFTVNGINPFDYAGYSVSGAGDINGDGLDDLIIGAYRAQYAAGASYVVFGSSAGFGATLDLADLDGTNGFTLNGKDAGDQAGRVVSGAGDINGDGIDDLIIRAPDADPMGRDDAGESYVVFGSTTGFGATLDLADLDGTNGFALIGATPGESSFGVSASGAGDVNGDGFADLIIGARDAVNLDGEIEAGKAYVVFGSGAGFDPVVDLADIDGLNGFTLYGSDADDAAGTSVSAAGDVNGDGVDDLVIGATRADPGGRDGAGEAYVIFGRQAETAPPAPNLYRIALPDIAEQTIPRGVFAQFIDAPGVQTYHVSEAAALALQGSAGANVFTLQLAAAEVTIARDVATVVVAGPNGERVSFSARETPQTLVFVDGAVEVAIADNEIVAGDQTLTDTPAPLIADPDPGDTTGVDLAFTGFGDVLIG
ncbi:MAG: hypothetical protein GVY13_16870 [Alphaproteobacteria bacterium]|jgi:hypothetical protein|nr:hypothetical protein [Alphaproteobacteria bacterium]